MLVSTMMYYTIGKYHTSYRIITKFEKQEHIDSKLSSPIIYVLTVGNLICHLKT